MYSRNFDSTSVPNNYKGTFYQFEEQNKQSEDKADEPVLKEETEESSVFKSTEKPHSLLSKGFSISLDTEDLLLLGLVFLLIANGEQSDMLLILALLFATGLFQF